MSKGTVHRTVRVEDGLWYAAKAVADARGETMSGVIRAALDLYAADNAPPVELLELVPLEGRPGAWFAPVAGTYRLPSPTMPGAPPAEGHFYTPAGPIYFH